MYRNKFLIVYIRKQALIIVNLVSLLASLSTIMTPCTNTNIKMKSDIKMIAHIIKFSTTAKVGLFNTELYNNSQVVHNGLCKNIFPDLIVIPFSTEDVSRIIKITRQHTTKPISIRSGGHSYICSNIRQGINRIFQG